MPGNDEHDPLDNWLSQQVQPLPPPPGTFELITRRARRRKIRKLAVTVASVAAVAVAVAVATPPLLSLHVSPSGSSGTSVAAGSTPSQSSGTQRTTGTASPYVTPTTAAPATSAKPPAPVPPTFQPASVTFVSLSTAWVIGQAGTPGTCANKDPYICTSIARTGDAGNTWQGAPAPSAGAPAGATGVGGIRFLDGVNGWAFGPELWATHDEGQIWTPVSTHGQRVTDLETAGDRAYALFATCSGTSPAGFAADCTKFALMTTTKDSDVWTPAGNLTSGLTDGGNPASAVLALTSTTGYLLAPDGTLYSGPLGGSWQKAGRAPCKPGAAQANGLPANGMLALVDSNSLAVACAPAGSNPLVYTSDGGASWHAQPAAAWTGLTSIGTLTSLTAAPDGALLIATTQGIYLLPVGSSRWQATSAAGTGAPSGGFTYVGMTTSTQGVALPADEKLHQIWMTFDGGRTWEPRTSITPGN